MACDEPTRALRGATFTPRRHQRNSLSVAATCSIDRSTRMTGRKRTSQRTSAAAFAVPRETPPSRRARTSRGHVELDGHALGPTGPRTPSPCVGFTVERRRARPPPNQARAPTTLRANLRRTSHSHYISDVPPPPKPRRRRRLRRRAARPRSRYHRSSRRTRSGQPVAQGVGLGRREVAPHASEAATPPSETSRRTPPARRTVAASVVQTKGRITDLKMEDILSYARVGEPTRRLHGLV